MKKIQSQDKYLIVVLIDVWVDSVSGRRPKSETVKHSRIQAITITRLAATNTDSERKRMTIRQCVTSWVLMA